MSFEKPQGEGADQQHIRRQAHLINILHDDLVSFFPIPILIRLSLYQKKSSVQ